MASSPFPRDRVLLSTRVLAAAIIGFLVLAFLVLYPWPTDTRRLFAWQIKPTMSAMVLGSVYLGGAYFFLRVTRASQWHTVAGGFLPVGTFASLMGVTTILHWDRFLHGNLAFWLWVALYFTTPFLVFAVFLVNRREYLPATGDEPRLPPAAAGAMVLAGGLSLVMGAFLYLFPQRAIGVWPWHLTPLTARMLGAIFALGLAGLGAARERRWSAARILVEVAGIMLVLILVAGVRAHREFDGGRPLTWLLAAGFAGTAVATVLLYVQMELRTRPRTAASHYSRRRRYSEDPRNLSPRMAHLEGMDQDGVAGMSGIRRFWGLQLVGTAVAAVLVAGCAAAPSSQAPGGGPGSGTASSSPGSGLAQDGAGVAAPPSGGDPQAALARWRSFPVATTPRPLVLTAGNVLDPPTGFATGDQKLAYIDGRFTLATELPAAPPTVDGYRIVQAQAALDQLRQAPGINGGSAAQPLRIVHATLGEATFGTDRGPRSLPAWRFALEGVSGAAQVLAVSPDSLWPPKPQPLGSPERATVAADGQSVTYSFYGTPPGPGPCGADYTAEVAESPTAAVISVRTVTATPAGGSSTSQACTAIAARRTVTVRLAAPLGARVLLTAQGTPISVTSR